MEFSLNLVFFLNNYSYALLIKIFSISFPRFYRIAEKIAVHQIHVRAMYSQIYWVKRHQRHHHVTINLAKKYVSCSHTNTVQSSYFPNLSTKFFSPHSIIFHITHNFWHFHSKSGLNWFNTNPFKNYTNLLDGCASHHMNGNIFVSSHRSIGLLQMWFFSIMPEIWWQVFASHYYCCLSTHLYRLLCGWESLNKEPSNNSKSLIHTSNVYDTKIHISVYVLFSLIRKHFNRTNEQNEWMNENTIPECGFAVYGIGSVAVAWCITSAAATSLFVSILVHLHTYRLFVIVFLFILLLLFLLVTLSYSFIFVVNLSSCCFPIISYIFRCSNFSFLLINFVYFLFWLFSSCSQSVWDFFFILCSFWISFELSLPLWEKHLY